MSRSQQDETCGSPPAGSQARFSDGHALITARGMPSSPFGQIGRRQEGKDKILFEREKIPYKPFPDSRFFGLISLP